MGLYIKSKYVEYTLNLFGYEFKMTMDKEHIQTDFLDKVVMKLMSEIKDIGMFYGYSTTEVQFIGSDYKTLFAINKNDSEYNNVVDLVNLFSKDSPKVATINNINHDVKKKIIELLVKGK